MTGNGMQLAGADRVEDSRLLVVDDDPSNTQLLVAALRRLGFNDLHTVADARLALRTVERLRPELVLTDWHMPHVDGADLLRGLKATARSSEIPVIVLTGDLEVRRLALELGASDFLSKPVDSIEMSLRIRNVLRLRRLHEQLRRQNHELEDRVRMRTRELEEANARLRRMARTRRDFVAMASHEMRTPLTVVLGFTAHWSRAGTAAIEDAHLDAAHRNARRLQHLVNNLLLASGIEGRPGGRRTDQCQLDELLRSGVAASGIEDDVAIRCPAGLSVDCDAELVRQVVANLVSNADRYGQPPIVVSATGSTDEVRVTVTDRGPGVPDAFIPYLFRRFSQATTGDRRTAVGAGLGLWLSRKIVELHGGRISYVPGPDGGGEFAFVLPRLAEGADPEGGPTPEHAPEVTAPVPLSSTDALPHNLATSLARREARITELMNGLIALRRLLIDEGEWERGTPAERLVRTLLRET